ncbi:MAG TPA: Gfo/Idh/MocA family oxidoreductase [Clostridiales bacterium]|nr:Gfo/Idh/MocA family oxidoreductase [Clostridiales bacterium]
MGNLRFGIIGCGLISNWHADAILQIEGTQLVGATDVNEKARAAFALKYNILAFNSVEELLASDDVDIVCICTPSGLHAPLAVKAANAGKHVIVEKPMAITLKQADNIIEACEKNNIKTTVISQSRFTNSICKLKNAVDKGLLGRLVSGDAYMKFYRSREYYDSGGWRGTWEMDGGGALMNQGIHSVDLIQYIMGPVKTIFAYTRTLARKIEVEDTAAAVLEYENGALGVIQATTSIYPGLPRRIEVSGDKGTIIVDGHSITNWTIEGNEVPDGIEIGKANRTSASDPAAFGIEGHIMQISDMVDAIKNNRNPLVDQYEGKKPVEIILAIYESSRTGKTIEFSKY